MAASGHSNQPMQSGLRLVLTRPQEQAAEMAAELASQGVDTLILPALEITRITPDRLDEQMQVDAIIFVSANAVHYGLPHIPRGHLQKAPCFAIGRATATALGANGILNVITPQTSNDSEALLALSSLQGIAGQHILLVGGRSEAGGRRLLAETLQHRGAIVTPLICYHRKPRLWSDGERKMLQQQLQAQQIHGIFAASVETLESLMTNLNGIHDWQRVPLLVPHPRIAAAAASWGWLHVIIVPLSGVPLIEALQKLKALL